MKFKNITSLSLLIAFSLFSFLAQAQKVAQVEMKKVAQNGVRLSAKMYLQGALIGVPDGEVLMRDDLREKGYLPIEEPYADLPSFTHVAPGGGESVVPEIFEIEGEEAIVDWVFIELRNPSDSDEVLHTRSALLRRDGMIVDVDGESPVFFEGVPKGEYLIAFYHRFHLATMTGNSFEFGPLVLSLDLTDPDFDFYCENAQVDMDGLKAIWVGDVNLDYRIIFQGPGTDVFSIFLEILSDPLNESHSPNFTSFGYKQTDINMDGVVNYSGPNNERVLFMAHVYAKIIAGNFGVGGCVF